MEVDNTLRTSRGRNIRTAILTSIVARLSGVLLQVVSLPFAAAALGNEGFALYAMMTAVLSWLSLSMLGLGPAITVSMSFNSVGSSTDFRTIFSTGVICMLAISIALSIVASIAIFATRLPDTVFALYHNQGDEIILSLCVVIAVFFFSVNLSSVEAAQLALQQQGRYNTLIAIGTLLASIGVIVVAQGTPTPHTILISAQTPVIGARLINAAIFLYAIPHLLPSLRLVRVAIAKSLLVQGSRFAMAGSVNNFLTHIFPVLVIGAIAPASYAAAFAATMNAVIVLSSVFSLTSRPLLGAVPEAHARNDVRWISSAYGRTLIFSASYGLFCFAVMSIFGTSIFDAWYQNTIHPSAILLSLAGLYVILIGVEVTNYTFLSAVGLSRIVSYALSTKSIIFSLILLLFSSQMIDYMPFAMLIITNILLSSLPLTFMAFRTIGVRGG